jgi:8-oxo-dGTP diphosphatase
MIKVEFHDLKTVDDSKLEFAVICSEFKSKWIWVKHKKRDTWEIPRGRREYNEDILSTAKRELNEETGAVNFEITEVCEYSVTKDGNTRYGRVYHADVKELKQSLDFEIEKIQVSRELPKELTYPQIQPLLLEKVIKTIKV